jgi:membrane protease YdiL (CAAX protease family)
MLKYCAYLILCLFFGFLDFYFNLRGLLSLLLYTAIAFLIIVLKHNNKTKLNFKVSYNNYLLYGIVSLISISILVGFLIQDFYKHPVDNDIKIDFYLIIATIIIAFAEEIIFRGYWLNNFLEKYNVNRSVFIVSFGFSFLHIFAGNDPIYAFIDSVILSYVFLKKQSISNTFIVHILNSMFGYFLFSKILLYYSSFDFWNKIISLTVIILITIYSLKMLFKKELKL